MSKLYRADNLDTIADQFDRMAKADTLAMASDKTVAARAEHRGSAAAWGAAAAMLRQTEMIPAREFKNILEMETAAASHMNPDHKAAIKVHKGRLVVRHKGGTEYAYTVDGTLGFDRAGAEQWFAENVAGTSPAPMPADSEPYLSLGAMEQAAQNSRDKIAILDRAGFGRLVVNYHSPSGYRYRLDSAETTRATALAWFRK